MRRRYQELTHLMINSRKWDNFWNCCSLCGRGTFPLWEKSPWKKAWWPLEGGQVSCNICSASSWSEAWGDGHLLMQPLIQPLSMCGIGASTQEKSLYWYLAQKLILQAVRGEYKMSETNTWASFLFLLCQFLFFNRLTMYSGQISVGASERAHSFTSDLQKSWFKDKE